MAGVGRQKKRDTAFSKISSTRIEQERNARSLAFDILNFLKNYQK